MGAGHPSRTASTKHQGAGSGQAAPSMLQQARQRTGPASLLARTLMGASIKQAQCRSSAPLAAGCRPPPKKNKECVPTTHLVVCVTPPSLSVHTRQLLQAVAITAHASLPIHAAAAAAAAGGPPHASLLRPPYPSPTPPGRRASCRRTRPPRRAQSPGPCSRRPRRPRRRLGARRTRQQQQ